MKIKIQRDALANALKKVKSGVLPRGSLPILTNVHVSASEGKVAFMTTTLDSTYRIVVPCEVGEVGETTMPFTTLFAMASKFPEAEVDIVTDASEVSRVTCGTSRFKLTGMPAAEFPKLPDCPEDPAQIALPAKTLLSMLRLVSYASSKDDTRRSLKSVLFAFKDGGLRLVATDGKRLACVDGKVDADVGADGLSLIVPSAVAQDLLRELGELGDGNVTIGMRKSLMMVTLGDLTIYAKLIDEKYPNYPAVIAAGDAAQTVINIDREMLVDAIDRASIALLADSPTITIQFEEGRLVIEARGDTAVAHEEVPVAYTGEKDKAMFNPAFLLEPMRVLTDDEIHMRIKDGQCPIVLESAGESKFIYIVMPLRV